MNGEASLREELVILIQKRKVIRSVERVLLVGCTVATVYLGVEVHDKSSELEQRTVELKEISSELEQRSAELIEERLQYDKLEDKHSKIKDKYEKDKKKLESLNEELDKISKEKKEVESKLKNLSAKKEEEKKAVATTKVASVSSSKPNVVKTSSEPAEKKSSSQYSDWKKMNVESTGYSLYGDSMGSDGTPETATGTYPTVGRTIAVDPSVIPYGTEVYIPAFNGVFIAEDTGGMINGNKIDIYMSHGDKAREWGRKNIEVYVNM